MCALYRTAYRFVIRVYFYEGNLRAYIHLQVRKIAYICAFFQIGILFSKKKLIKNTLFC